MGEKIKVSQETANSIEYALDRGTKESLLIYHTNGFNEGSTLKGGKVWTHDDYVGMNVLSPEQLAIALYIGYEIEKTPEELVAETYLEKRKLIGTALINKWENDAYANGIMFTLETLGIKIKGVNDCC